MCGIAGIFDSKDRLAKEELQVMVRRMTDAINHRGPDDEGVWLDERCPIGLGHRRLSILDLSAAGHQPMESHCSRYVIVFNGEIYNFGDIKSRLEVDGDIEWRGHSDTEVLLASVARYGLVKTLNSLNGMFAFALWDKHLKELHLCRDRAGKKPLFYGWQNGLFIFSSELKAFKAALKSGCAVNRDAVAMLMQMNFIPSPHSILEGVFKLPPSTLLSLTYDQLRSGHGFSAFPRSEYSYGMPWHYWSAKELLVRGARNPLTENEGTVLDHLETLLKDSVQKRMIADVPVGGFLSGGIDSALTVSLMQAQAGKAVKSFTIGYNEPGNEAHYAREISQHLGTDHTELYVTPAQVLDEIPRLPQISDEPHGDTAIIPTFLVSQLARKDVTVVLSGDGGDELFAGYPRYLYGHDRWLRAKKRVSWIPELPLKAMLRLIRDAPPGIAKAIPMGKHFVEMERLLRIQTPEELYHNSIDQWPKPYELVLDSGPTGCLMIDKSYWPQDMDPIQRMVYLDLAGRMPDSIVSKVDRASMAVSLEARCPILDYRVIEYAATIPMNMKIRNGYGKWILRQLLHRYVPQSMVDRPKTGFKLPLCDWIKGDLRNWAGDLLNPEKIRREGFLNPALVEQKYDEHISGKNEWHYQLWNILMFQAWLDKWNADGAFS